MTILTLSHIRTFIFGIFLTFAPTLAHSQDFLEPDKAFHFSARMLNPDTIAVTYDIADGYYMYRDRFKFSTSGATLGVPTYPRGKVKFDETFQKEVETYRHQVTVTLPVKASGSFTVSSVSQGCADAGLCYSPQEATVHLTAVRNQAVTMAARRNRQNEK